MFSKRSLFYDRISYVSFYLVFLLKSVLFSSVSPVVSVFCLCFIFHPQVKDRCQKGIPPSLRGRAWLYLSGAKVKKEQHKGKFQVFSGLIQLFFTWIRDAVCTVCVLALHCFYSGLREVIEQKRSLVYDTMLEAPYLDSAQQQTLVIFPQPLLLLG